jgi:hypothetical protein
VTNFGTEAVTRLLRSGQHSFLFNFDAVMARGGR